jgi:hypothetical protein
MNKKKEMRYIINGIIKNVPSEEQKNIMKKQI